MDFPVTAHSGYTLDIWKHIHWFNCNLLHCNQLMRLKLKVLHHRLVHLSERNVQSQPFTSKRKTDHFFLKGLTSKLWKLVNTLNLIYCFFPQKPLFLSIWTLQVPSTAHTESPFRFLSSLSFALLPPSLFLSLSPLLGSPQLRGPGAFRPNTHTLTHTPIHPPTDAAGNA